MNSCGNFDLYDSSLKIEPCEIFLNWGDQR